MKIQSTSNNRQFCGLARGFSLFEMVIVMGIIGVILGGVIFSSRSFSDSARVQRVRSDFNTIGSQIDTYEMLGKRGFPTEAQGLDALVKKPTSSPIPRDWTNSLPEIPRDPWTIEYQYKMPGKDGANYELISAGKDKIFGTEDDLSSQD
ncbi:type II secretion system major pseudopilin GspG [bacterium]|nr:type II secretion system major pseudopilin GspG [bacterium]